MTLNFQSWMRAVWMSVIEPSAMAKQVIAMRFDMRSLWSALMLTVILNVLLLATLRFMSPVPMVFQDQVIELSPFAYTTIIGCFTVLFVLATYYVGRMLDGKGDLQATLTVLVWFQAVSLTLEAGQVLLVLFSPYMAALYGVITLGAMLWCIVNFVNVLHQFESLGKSLITLALAMVATALGAGILLMLLGISPAGGMT